jgi:hypothetical protein
MSSTIASSFVDGSELGSWMELRGILMFNRENVIETGTQGVVYSLRKDTKRVSSAF